MYFNVRISLKMLRAMGLNPFYHHRITSKILFYFGLFALLANLYLGTLLFIYEKHLTIANVITSLEAIFLTIHVLVKYTVLYKNSHLIRSLIEDTELFWSLEESSSEDEKNNALSYLTRFKLMFIYYLSFGSFTSMFFTLNPILSGQRILPLTSYVPEYPPYTILFIVEECAYCAIFFLIIPFDTIVGSLTILTAMQWKLLNGRFQEILNRIVDTPEDKVMLQKELGKCVDHHNFLIRYVSRLNDALFFALAPYVLIIVVSNCSELFIISLSPPTPLLIKCITYVIALLNEYIMFYCIPGQILTVEAEKTVQYIFASKWYANSSCLKKPIINIVTMMSRRQIGINVSKIMNLNFENMLKSFRMIISYYMFLKTLELSRNEGDS
ncbi:odorant receptor 63a-like [Diorhabda sublineata]|uniref:odorant receptor 63a-like n=1 Tax=Diorhabda sublineata TaxID=1163346 RepID=UPI0024E1078D|nr:odorant receptor 63a-like [Diorhabda sublineata]